MGSLRGQGGVSERACLLADSVLLEARQRTHQ